MLTLEALLHLCHYEQQCWVLVADWEVKGSVESLQGVLDGGILDLPITEINVEGDCMKIWLGGLEEDGKS